jgi:hypothetical protein
LIWWWEAQIDGNRGSINGDEAPCGDEEPIDMGSVVVSLRGDFLEMLGGIEACGEIKSGEKKGGLLATLAV